MPRLPLAPVPQVRPRNSDADVRGLLAPKAMKRADTASARAWQRMLSGRRLDLLDPSALDVEIEDIAHGLARVARWNGQTKGAHIFSVAQHSLLVEAVFNWPGVGGYVAQSIVAQDFAPVQGAILLGAVVYSFLSLATDILYGVADPRIRVGYA